MAGDSLPQDWDSFGNERGLQARPVPVECFYLGGMMQVVPEGCGCRIGGFGESHCVLLHRLPCPDDCPDRKPKR